ncbi:MAG: ABC transporter permease [Muribaculaceae bacterium]|nr:ABC transporter permease [Muribaculaceae bacterium]
MEKLKLIILNEYKTAVCRKAFWIMTLIFPLLLVGFGLVMGFLSADSQSFASFAESVNDKTGMQPDADTMTPAKAIAMMVGLALTMAMLTCGGQVMQMVRQEKTNRIMEFLATCVPGRTMLTAKIISVALITLTQVGLWAVFILGCVIGAGFIFNFSVPWHYLLLPMVWKALIWSCVYFFGGYLMFASLFAACGALTDSNNENQQYQTILMLSVLGSMYVGFYAVDHPTSVLAQVCAFFPLTSPTVGAVNAITGEVPVWLSIISVIVLYACAYGAIIIGGKIYASSMLLKGSNLTPKTIMAFIKSK